jgi:hypothetical protein
MPPQTYDWTCSVCSFDWVIGATGTADLSREDAAMLIGYPDCVDETYGLKDTRCLINAYAGFGLVARQAWVTFDQAYAIAQSTTGQLNGLGWYHFAALRGVDHMDVGELWIANSAPGYRGVYESLSRSQFNALGPFQVVYLAQPQPQDGL